MTRTFRRRGIVLFTLCLAAGSTFTATAQLFDNLSALGTAQYSVGDPDPEVDAGPKDVAVADLDNDGRKDLVVSREDGFVTMLFGAGDGMFGGRIDFPTFVGAPTDSGGFAITNHYTNVFCENVLTNIVFTNIPPALPIPGPPPVPIISTVAVWVCVGEITRVEEDVRTIEGPVGLRGLALADFNGDLRVDIAVASPGEGVIHLLLNQGGRVFADAVQIPAWLGVRDLAAGEFDGDGVVDLAAAGSTNGLAQYRSLGDGGFELVTTFNEAGYAYGDPEELNDFPHGAFPQPAFYLTAFRNPGETRDRILLGRAQSTNVWTLAPDLSGRLRVDQTMNLRVTSFDIGPLLRPASSGVNDIVTGFSRSSGVDIYSPASEGDPLPGPLASRLSVPGGPRTVRIVDLNLDGWNDLVVVSQGDDRVVAYHNEEGVFRQVSTALTGDQPREMDLGDFNGDGRPDLAVLNRESETVSILLTSDLVEAGFLTLDSVFQVDGEISGLELRDFNGDGRPDILQLHRATAEFSVRFTGTNGLPGPPEYFSIGVSPSAQAIVDANGDGIIDLVTADLKGQVSVRLGLAGGGFGEEISYQLPADARGALFALVPGDFNNDGFIDLAAGYLDCRLALFKGDGAGGFVHTGTHEFIYESRSMVAGDFDQDGDLDLAGGSLINQFCIVENPGNLLEVASLTKTIYRLNSSDGRSLLLVDQNGDNDPDLVVGSGLSASIWLGAAGVTFVPDPQTSPVIGGSSMVFADFDGNGVGDLATICGGLNCLNLLVMTNGDYAPALTVTVPITRYLGTADLDGDGFADLVGTGDMLWVALSGRRASNAPPAALIAPRNENSGVVINELLASNTGLPLELDGDRTSDWVEIYNGTDGGVALQGWQLMLVKTNLVGEVGGGGGVVEILETNRYTFPPDGPLDSRGHKLLICSTAPRSIYHTGFRLPAEGGLLCLFDAMGTEVDRINYPPQDEDLSYARYLDGMRAFSFNNIPSPESPNADNGAVDPVVTFDGIDLAGLQTPGQPLRFRARARDDLGIINVSVRWRRLDIPDDVTKNTVLFDDGAHDDGGFTDGVFAGTLTNQLPPGAEIQFYIECIDLSDQLVTIPGNPRFVPAGQMAQTYALAVGVPLPPLEISELVADNRNGLQDEGGGTPDWVEIRNCSPDMLSLDGVSLGGRLFGGDDRKNFNDWPGLNPVEHLVLYADGKPGQGMLHTPFQLNQAGERLVLTGTTPRGARFLIDFVEFGPQREDLSLARLGLRGPWIQSRPTPRSGNVAGGWAGFADPGAGTFTFGFPTLPGRSYVVEHGDSIINPVWTALPPITGNGVEKTVTQTRVGQQFYRLRVE